MKFELTRFLIRYEKAIPFVLFILFLLVTVPGISWGAPGLWNVDELYWRVNKALGGELIFDETEPDYNYPSLPKYAMYAVSWTVRELGGNASQRLISARLISVLLGGLTVLMVYYLARTLSKNIYIHLLAAFLMLSNMILAHNARFAHNDLYLLFFITLSLVSLIRYRLTENRLWIYLAFFSVGCATSSKYTGATFGIVAAVVFLVTNGRNLFANWLRTIETITISFVLTVSGYVIGTPKALLWMSYYFKRVIPAALRNASYGRTPDALPGIIGQWGVFQSGVGAAVFYLFIVALLWHFVNLMIRSFRKPTGDEGRNKAISVILLAIIIFNIPYLFSYNYQSRFFLPFIPMFSLLASLFVEDLIQFFRARKLAFAIPVTWTAISLIIFTSLLSVISVMLLFKNDARIAASKFINTLKPDTHIEYTLYPPHIPENHFSVARNYPIYFIKYLGEEVPTNKPYQYNLGEDGLYERGADYFVVDNFTYSRFSDEYICETNPVECNFFEKLRAGETSLRLLGEFEYSLPLYLPQISLTFVNPDVKVYEVPR